MHDESLLRSTDVTCRFAGDPRGDSGFLVSDFDLDELRTLDAGSWFLEPDGGPRTASGFGTLACLKVEARERFASGSIRVPTLVEALRLTDRLNWMVNVELKSFPNTNPSLLDAVLVTIDATETAARVLISSFDHGDVARAARLRPEIATGVLTATPLACPQVYVRELVGADFFHPSTVVLGAESAAYRRRPSPQALRTSDLIALRGAASRCSPTRSTTPAGTGSPPIWRRPASVACSAMIPVASVRSSIGERAVGSIPCAVSSSPRWDDPRKWRWADRSFPNDREGQKPRAGDHDLGGATCSIANGCVP